MHDLENEEDAALKAAPKQISTKEANKRTKKERKLVQIFAQKFLFPKIPPNEHSSQLLAYSSEEVNRTGSSTINFRNLLIDNRNYQLAHSTETLRDEIEASGCAVEDIFVLPSKIWILLRFASPSDLIRFREMSDLLFSSSKFGLVQLSNLSDRLFDLAVQIYQPQVDRIVEAFNPNRYPPGLRVINDFVSCDEEKMLFAFAEKSFTNAAADGANQISKLKNRCSIHFGHVFDYAANTISRESSISVIDRELPQECHFLLDRFSQSGLASEPADQLTINRYLSGDHIPPHIDTHSMCTDTIICVSIRSDVVMNFSLNGAQPSDEDEAVGGVVGGGQRQKMVWLRQRSAMVMSDEARYRWRHAISQTSLDMRPLQQQQCHNTPPADARLALSPRDLRYSFTFRKVHPADYQCRCRFVDTCDSQKSQKATERSSGLPAALEETRAAEVEQQFVHETYDRIADHFSGTRYGQWPAVVHFLDSLPAGSLILDVGCGNGKYLSARSGSQSAHLLLGCDFSRNLLNICARRGFETFQDNCLSVGTTLRSGLFDAAICIAVIHHLATEQRRLEALRSIVRLLRAGGRALIYVWAFEQKHRGQCSKYLKRSDKHNNEPNERSALCKDPVVAQHEDRKQICVHTNRTQFRKQDLFVPWKQQASSSSGSSLLSCPDSSKSSTVFRYYHVFREGELEALIVKLGPVVQLERIFYDQGNWCAIFTKC